ncbi:response regulator [Methylobacillus gramineus]|uniref:response regulator n=1 Tax=Methylobacillus gramineus TaxID=755169 RepID=UPI001CFFB883|nr:response regulator [Methylobacillus gramineus]MCB5183921.1 response regulator [Methylobacillus gramineus]
MSRSRSNAEPNPRLMKVLLVEDSALLREAIMDILSSCTSLTFAGIAVTQNEAIDKLHQEQFDLALVDIELAQGNGFEVIRATQTDDFPFPRPTYLILTNHAYPQYQERAQELGVEYFFDKSMDFDIAIDTIEAEAAKFQNKLID